MPVLLYGVSCCAAHTHALLADCAAGGMIASYHRVVRPDVFDAAVAASAPIYYIGTAAFCTTDLTSMVYSCNLPLSSAEQLRLARVLLLCCWHACTCQWHSVPVDNAPTKHVLPGVVRVCS